MKFLSTTWSGALSTTNWPGKDIIPFHWPGSTAKLAASPEGKDWQKSSPKELCRILGATGLIFPEIITATMLKTVAYDEYSIEVRITLYDGKGESLGSWTESASKKKIAIPTSAIGALATIAVAAMDEPARKHMRPGHL